VYSTQNSVAPNTGASIVYNFTGTTGFGSTLHASWSETPPTFNSTNNTIYYALYTATEGITNNTRDENATGSEVTFSDIGTGTSFTGLVTFASASGDFSDDAGTITEINGGRIKTDTIDTNQLAISSSSGSNRIHMDGGNNRIDIYDGPTLRVRIGNLA